MIETGVLFDDIHSFRDLNLVLAPFVLPPAKPKTNYIDVPGRDGSIDATETTGEVKYNDREFSFTFTVFPKDDLTFEERQTVVSNALNGKRCKITIEKDPDYYLEGRCTVNEHFANKRLRQIVVGVRVRPYKLKHNETTATFDLSANEKRTIYLTNGKKPVVPSISASGIGSYVSITFDGLRKNYYKTTRNSDIRLKNGVNVLDLQAASNGAISVTFSYQEGDL